MYLIKLIIRLIFFLIYINYAMASNKYNTDHLTDLQKKVTLQCATENPFDNEYWNNKKEGIYVDIISKKPLFSSKDKFDSGTGWPSFTKTINKEVITEHVDKSHNMTRVEVKSKSSDAHLGHVFNDGPNKEHGSKRYCINSASIKFIPKENLEKEGYGEYLKLFEEKNKNIKKAILAGGCFWGMEDLFSKLPGVLDVKNGYSGGSKINAIYELVSLGITNHAEAVEVTYDSNKISYENILKFFFKIHDPTTLNRQGNDIGKHYRSAIFYQNEKEKEIAEQLIIKANKSKIYKNTITTTLEKFDNFYEAEEYHQDYLKNHPGGYSCHKIRPEWEL